MSCNLVNLHKDMEALNRSLCCSRDSEDPGKILEGRLLGKKVELILDREGLEKYNVIFKDHFFDLEEALEYQDLIKGMMFRDHSSCSLDLSVLYSEISELVACFLSSACSSSAAAASAEPDFKVGDSDHIIRSSYPMLKVGDSVHIIRSNYSMSKAAKLTKIEKGDVEDRLHFSWL